MVDKEREIVYEDDREIFFNLVVVRYSPGDYKIKAPYVMSFTHVRKEAVYTCGLFKRYRETTPRVFTFYTDSLSHNSSYVGWKNIRTFKELYLDTTTEACKALDRFYRIKAGHTNGLNSVEKELMEYLANAPNES